MIINMKKDRIKIKSGFLADRHPFSLLVFFLCVILISMFSKNPVILLISVFFSLGLLLKLRGLRNMLKFLRLTLILALLTAIINPMFNHRGRTVLARFKSGNALTLEACFYGLYAALILISVFAWFSGFNHCFDTDKLLYIFGSLSPRLALTLSMSLRFVPEFTAKAGEIRKMQKMLGGVGKKGLMGKFRNAMAVFGALLTWVLESSVTRSESMKMRGYGQAKRRMYSIYRWEAEDTCLTVFSLVFTGVYILLLSRGSFDFWFYPVIYGDIFSAGAVLGYAVLAALMLLPVIFDNRLEGRRFKEYV